jgi:DNA primase
MPGIDYRRVRAAISMDEVLKLIGFEASSCRGDQLRGRCPLQACQQTVHHAFSVDVGRGVFRCFACRAGGNQLDLWAIFHGLPLHEAAQSLCRRTHASIPWLTSRKG